MARTFHDAKGNNETRIMRRIRLAAIPRSYRREHATRLTSAQKVGLRLSAREGRFDA